MGHRMCRECHQLVSEKARTCPRCGVPRPVVTHNPDALFAGYRGGLTLILVLLAVGITWVRYQLNQLAGFPMSTSVAAADSLLLDAPSSRPLGRDSFQLGPMVKSCPPEDVDCVPMVPVACPAPWSPESGRPAPRPLSPREQEWCEANKAYSWSFSITNMRGGGAVCSTSSPIQITLQQGTTTLSGYAGGGVLTCTAPHGSFSTAISLGPVFNGQISGTEVSFDLGSADFHQVGTVNGSSMAGTATWTFESGSASTLGTLTGSWTATRQ